ncbi:MAG: LamG-like jellyroll fold domain-containing protein [Sedimentisphaerales bacterium]
MLAKKCLLVVIFTVLSVSLAIADPPAVHPTTGEPLVIDCLRGTPDAIDGDLSDWNLEAMTPAVLDVVEQLHSGQDSWDGPEDCSGEFYLLWDDVNIYIAVVVKDDKLSMNKTGGDIWNADAIEVLFSTLNAVADHSEHYQYGFTANNQRWNWCNIDGAGNIEPDYLQIASSVTADGYICEASIEYGQMPSLDFSVGNTIGFHPVFDGTDNGDRELQMTWTGREAHDQSLGFGHMVLSADPVSAGEAPVTIPISNAGFEDPVLADDDWTWLDIPGWTPVGGEGAGIWHVTSADFDPVVAPEGQNVLYSENAVGDAGGMAQVLTETFAANTDYTLTVEVGNSNYYYYAGYSVQLLSGGVVIAEDNDTLWPEYSKWVTSTVEYTYNPADAALVGQPLEIRLITLALDKDNPPAGEIVGVEFDNVTLSYVGVIPVNPGTDGLVAYYALENDANDSSGNGLDGVIVGEPAFVEGAVGMGLQFDGVDDYVDLGNDPIFDITGSEVTLALWVNTQDIGTGENNPWLGKGDTSYMLKGHRENNEIEFFIYDGGWITAHADVGADFNGEWHHAAGVFDGEQLIIYVDGEEAVAVDYEGVGIVPNAYNVALGSNTQASGRFSESILDEAMIYNKALSAGEISFLAGFRENLVLNPSFEEDEVILDDPDWYSWCTWNPAEGAGSNATIVDTDSVDGARSLLIEPVGPENWHFIVVGMPIPTEVGASYTASFWAKAAEPRPLGVQWKATDNSDQWGYADFELTTEWAEYSLTADALNVETKLEFFCATSEAPFWIDAVSVTEE